MNGPQKRILLLVPTTSYRTRDFLNAAYRLGLDVLLGTDEKQALDEVAGSALTAFDFEDVEKGAEQIEAFAAGQPLDAVVGVDDGSNALAARAAERLGLTSSGFEAVMDARNKHRFRHG